MTVKNRVPSASISSLTIWPIGSPPLDEHIGEVQLVARIDRIEIRRQRLRGHPHGVRGNECAIDVELHAGSCPDEMEFVPTGVCRHGARRGFESTAVPAGQCPAEAL